MILDDKDSRFIPKVLGEVGAQVYVQVNCQGCSTPTLFQTVALALYTGAIAMMEHSWIQLLISTEGKL